MYGILITFGIAVSALLAERKLSSKKEKEIMWDGIFWTILGGLIGARLYHVIDYWELYRYSPVKIIQVWNGGLGIYGAIIGGILATIVYLKLKKQPVLFWLDIAGLVMPLGQSIGRWGNYFNKEHLPYAYYESGLDLLLFITLLKYYPQIKNKHGTIFCLYLIGYASIRFALEPIKERSWEIHGINVAQSVSILVIIVASGILWKINRKKTS